MSEKFTQYYATLQSSLQAQARGDFEREDELLFQLDRLWLSMDPVERAKTDELNRSLARANCLPQISVENGLRAGVGLGSARAGTRTLNMRSSMVARSWLNGPAPSGAFVVSTIPVGSRAAA